MSSDRLETLITKVIAALDPGNRLRQIHSVRAEGEVEYSVPGEFRICGQWQVWCTQDGRYHEIVDLPGENTRVRVLNGPEDPGWEVPAEGPVRAMPDDVRADVLRNVYVASLSWIFRGRIDGKIAYFGHHGSHHDLEVTFDGINGVRISIDESDWLPHQITWLKRPAKSRSSRHTAMLRQFGRMGCRPEIATVDETNEDSTAVLTAWKEKDGIRYPSRIELNAPMEQKQVFTIEAFELNPWAQYSSNPGLFQKPELPARFTFMQGTRSTTVPFRLVDGRIVVDLFVNDHGPLSFLFDTGSSTTIIDETLYKKLGLKSRCEFNSLADDTALKEMIVCEGIKITLNGLQVDTQNMLVAQLHKITETRLGLLLDGLLGGSFIKNFVVELDYRNQVLILYESGHYRWDDRKRPPIKLEVDSGVPFITGKMTTVEGKELTGRMMIDTGSDWDLVFTKPFADKNKLKDVLGLAIETLVVGVTGETPVLVGRLKEVGLDQSSIPDPVVAIPERAQGTFAADTFAGLLGAEVLQNYSVLLDYQGARMSVLPHPEVKKLQSIGEGPKAEYDMSGLVLMDTKEGFQIAFVVSNSPAEECGLQKGDVITQINSVPVDFWTLREWRYINRRPGKTYTLSIIRHNDRFDRAIQMKPLV